jgi:hypothetical protein
VKEQESAFEALVQSVSLDDGSEPPISYTDVPGWKKDPKFKERFASYSLPARGKLLEIKISRITEKPGWPSIVHRLEKEMNFPLSENPAEVVKFDNRTDLILARIELEGLGVYQVSEREPGLPDAPRLKFELPKGWERQPTSDDFTIALFKVSDKDKKTARVSLTSVGGDLMSNVDRWAPKVGLPMLSKEEVERRAETFEVAGAKAQYIDLDNPNGKAALTRILGVLVTVEGRPWVIYMGGPSDLVGQHQGAFKSFVKSFKVETK